MKADVVALNSYVFDRTRRRLDGLTDAEYLWEPAPGCWTIRPRTGGVWSADGPSGQATGPLTTIAWRLWHLIGCYGSPRNAEWLGSEWASAGDLSPCPTAKAALGTLERSAEWWAALLESLTDEQLELPLGPVAGTFAESTRASFVLHQIDEQIHHGAEIGVLRDLYSALGIERR